MRVYVSELYPLFESSAYFILYSDMDRKKDFEIKDGLQWVKKC
jgi:hypothetical protein